MATNLPVIYYGEAQKVDSLRFKNSEMSSTGDIQFASGTSNVVYNTAVSFGGAYANQGEAGFVNMLLTEVLSEYEWTAEEYNALETRVSDNETAISSTQSDLSDLSTIVDINRTAKEDTGSANTYVVNTDGTFDLTKDGNIITFIPSNNNTGASTINIDSEGAKTISKPDEAGGVTTLEADDLIDGVPVTLIRRTTGDFFLLAPKGGNNIKNVSHYSGTFNSNIGSGYQYDEIPISEVFDASKTIISTNNFSADSDYSPASGVRFELFDSTTVRAYALAGGTQKTIYYSFDVIEFKNIIKSSYTATSSLVTDSIPISTIDLTKSYINFTGFNTLQTTSNYIPRLFFADDSNVTVTRSNGSSGFAVSFDVVSGV